MSSKAIDTLGKLLAAGFEIFGNCSDCAAGYRMDLPAEQRQPSTFPIDVRALIATHGADHSIMGNEPHVACP
jgi:hypothetical protein